MAKLTRRMRDSLPASDYVFPDRAPNSGSYPIPDVYHAHAALMLSAGKPEEGAVRAAVKRKFGIT